MMRPSPVILLSALCSALLGTIGFEWRGEPGSATPPAQPGVGTLQKAAPLDFVMPSLTSYSEVVSRPLFSPIRRPGEEGPADAGGSSMTLVAVVISPQGPHALVRYGHPPRLDRVVEGQALGGWTAETIERDRVILRRGAAVLELVPVSERNPQAETPPSHPQATPARNPG